MCVSSCTAPRAISGLRIVQVSESSQASGHFLWTILAGSFCLVPRGVSHTLPSMCVLVAEGENPSLP